MNLRPTIDERVRQQWLLQDLTRQAPAALIRVRRRAVLSLETRGGLPSVDPAPALTTSADVANGNRSDQAEMETVTDLHCAGPRIEE